MTDEERRSFEQQLGEDEELREIYRYTLRVVRVVNDRNSKIEKINRWNAEHTVVRKHHFYNTFAARLFYGVAAAAAVVTAVFLTNRHPSMPEFNAMQYESYRGSNSIQHVATLISEKKYDNAIYVIEREEKEYRADADSLNRILLNASAEEAECIGYEKNASKLDYDELRWLKVYALVGLERYDEAEQLLEDIGSEEGKYKEKADSMLGR